MNELIPQKYVVDLLLEERKEEKAFNYIHAYTPPISYSILPPFPPFAIFPASAFGACMTDGLGHAVPVLYISPSILPTSLLPLKLNRDISLHGSVSGVGNPQMTTIYLNLAVHLPITSPWHTSSALNSDPSSARRMSK